MTFIRKFLAILSLVAILQSYFVTISMDNQKEPPFDIGHYLFLGANRFLLPQQEVKINGMPTNKEEQLICVTNHTGATIDLSFIFTIPSKPEKIIAISSLPKELPVGMQLKMQGKDLFTILNQAINDHPSQILGNIINPIDFQGIITQIRLTSSEVDAVLKRQNIGNFYNIKSYTTNGGIFEQQKTMCVSQNTATQIISSIFTFHEKITLPVEKNYSIIKKYYGADDKNQLISDFVLTNELIQLSPKKEVPLQHQEQQNSEEYVYDQSPTNLTEETTEEKIKNCTIY